MPRRWRACLAGDGDIDLRKATVATDRHLFWSRRTLTSRVTGFFGSKMLRGRTAPLPQEHWPAVLQDAEHVGAVYALDEMVLDVPRLQQALAEPHGTWIRKIEAEPQIAPRGDAIAI